VATVNPFAPMPTGPEATWTAADHQRAAHELLGHTPNGYDPAIRCMRDARDNHQRKAAALRQLKPISHA
jgi:hypothetical protein